jgi:hypothetical protein
MHVFFCIYCDLVYSLTRNLTSVCQVVGTMNMFSFKTSEVEWEWKLNENKVRKNNKIEK